MEPRDLLLGALVVALLAAAISILVARAIGRALRRRALRERFAHAGEGERRAAQLLEDAGYTLLGAQLSARYALVVDGEAQDFGVRADYMVTRGGRTFVAEVKTGAVATRIASPATRRQLLEYGLAFDADGVLLVDADAGHVHVVELPWRSHSDELRTK